MSAAVTPPWQPPCSLGSDPSSAPTACTRTLLQINMYQPLTGQAACLLCSKGSSTDSTGNSECKKCPLGYYSPTDGSLCLPAPKGTFVGTVGATFYNPW